MYYSKNEFFEKKKVNKKTVDMFLDGAEKIDKLNIPDRPLDIFPVQEIISDEIIRFLLYLLEFEEKWETEDLELLSDLIGKYLDQDDAEAYYFSSTSFIEEDSATIMVLNAFDLYMGEETASEESPYEIFSTSYILLLSNLLEFIVKSGRVSYFHKVDHAAKYILRCAQAINDYWNISVMNIAKIESSLFDECVRISLDCLKETGLSDKEEQEQDDFDYLEKLREELEELKKSQFKTTEDYLNEGYAKCIYVKSSDRDDKRWKSSKVWGKIKADEYGFGFYSDPEITSKTEDTFISSELCNGRFVGVFQTPEADDYIPGYKMTSDRNRLLKVQIKHSDEIKEFIFDLKYNHCDDAFHKIARIIESPSGSYSNNSGSSNPNCFVATVVYESNHSTEVIALRKWRDSYLSQKRWGKAFIKFYYKHGEKISLIIGKKPIVKKWIKKCLDGFVSQIKS